MKISINGEDAKFSPIEIKSDGAGAFRRAARANFPEKKRQKNVSCEFHFKENVNCRVNVFLKDNKYLTLYLLYIICSF